MFKVIVSGSSEFRDFRLFVQTLDQLLGNKFAQGENVVILSEMGDGVEQFAAYYVKKRNCKMETYPTKHNGTKQTQRMVKEADALIAFVDTKSTDALEMARARRLPVRVARFTPPKPIMGFHQPGYEFLSNFHPCNIMLHLGGKDYMFSTAEHAYQASKAADQSQVEQIWACPTPGKAKRLGRLIKAREDWDDVRYSCMSYVLSAKFYQNGLLARQLMATYPARLIEVNTWGDTFWGVDPTGRGYNHLGEILMEVRNTMVENMVK